MFNYGKQMFSKYNAKYRKEFNTFTTVKRVHRESIALHLITLPQFIGYAQKNKWPKRKLVMI